MGRKRGGHAQHDGSQGGASNPVPPETAGEEGNSDAQLEGILAALGGPAEGRDLADEVDIILDVGEEGGEGDALLDSGMVAGGGSSASAQTLAQEVSAVADDAPDTHRAYPGKAETSIEQRPTVQSLQARRAAAEEVMRTRKDKGAALLLFLLLTFSVGVLLYGLREGSIEALESAEAAKTLGLFGKGFLQMVAIKDTLFIRVPAQTAVLGTLWIVVLHWRAKLMVYLSVFGSAGFGVFASAYLLFHGSNHGSLPVMIMAGLSMAITILASCRGCGTLSPEAVDVTCTAIQEAHAWMRPRRVRMTTGRWRARSLLNALDSVVLISATLLLVSLLLQAALAAGSVHVWSISAGRGIMGLFPRILLLHLFLTTAWGMSFISALHRSMISAVLSRRYFAPPEPDADGSIDVGDGTEGDGSAGISPLESLSLVLERHGTAIAKGSMVVWPLRTLRTVQLVLERWCGKALVTRVFQTIPGMLEAIYVSRHSYVVLVQAEKPCSFLFAAKSLYRLFSREHCSKILPGLLCLTVYNSGEIVAGWAAVLVAAQAASLAGGVLHWLTAMVAWLVALAVFKHVTSLSRHAVDALAVCYVQEVEACRPDAPVRVALALHDAVEHCWTLVAEDRAERDKSYSLESETVHTGDAL